MDDLFMIRFHHGGVLVRDREYRYENGKIARKDNYDGDILSIIEITEMVKDLGYASVVNMWFRAPNEDLTMDLRPLMSDTDVITLVKLMAGHKEVDVYIEHDVIEPRGVIPAPYFPEFQDVDFNGPEINFRDSSSDEGLVNEGQKSLRMTSNLDQNVVKDQDQQNIISSDDKILDEVTNIDWEGVVEDDDELHSIYSSCDEYEGDNWNILREPYNPRNIIFKVGMVFASIEFFKSVLEDYAVYECKNIKYIKCEKTQVRAGCEGNCEWLIHASTLADKQIVQIKTYIDRHTCARSYSNRFMTAQWIAKNMVSSVRSQPDMKITSMQTIVHERYGLGCSRSKAFRAKRMAIELSEGDYREQYGLVREYCDELLRSNPGSTCIMQCSVAQEGSSYTPSKFIPRFERMYMCLAACKKGFIEGCRPLISIDGCHLKGPCGGILLSAVCLDPNERIFPIAFGVVEAETKDSWAWFLDLLLDDVGNSRRLTFMSDQQKGLVPTLAERAAYAEHRFCLRHLYSNFKKSHPSLQLRELMWAASNSTYTRAFEYVMQKIKEMDTKAWEWLSKLDKKSWCKSAFTVDALNDMNTNNLLESYNSRILQAREKPIIGMMDAIRVSLMTQFQQNRDKSKGWKSSICPQIAFKLECEKKKINEWMVKFAGRDMFEITGFYKQFIVDLCKHTCSCRKWDITGLPCVHACAAMFFKKVDVEDFVHPCYKKTAYDACYANIIFPINGRDMWPRSDLPRSLPPLTRRAPGRPKKSRRRDPGERQEQQLKLSRKKTKIKCKKCGQFGHNKRGCKMTQSVDANSAGTTTPILSRQHPAPTRSRQNHTTTASMQPRIQP